MGTSNLLQGARSKQKEIAIMAIQPVPDGYHTVTPYLIVKEAARALEFYKQAFNATELMRLNDPEGKIAHAEFKIGNSPIMIADEAPQMGYCSPQSLGGSPVSLMLYVEDVDAQFKQVIASGGKSLRPVEDQFYGDRCGTLEDPFGHIWTIATHKEDVPSDEIERRFETMQQPKIA
jgi:PhnB protein